MLTVETFETISDTARNMRDRTHYIGGGTLLMRGVNFAAQNVDRLIKTNDQSIRQIQNEGGQIRIGAGVTMTDVMQSSDLAFLSPVARSVGGPAIRNMGTVGGNLFARSPFGDFATALLALDAKIAMSDGSEMQIEQFLASREAQSGLVVSITVPRPSGDEFRFEKITRVKPRGAAVMAIAAWLPRQGGRLANVRVAFGAMGPTPLRAKSVEAALEGQNLDQNSVQNALRNATDGLDPPDDSLASSWYRSEVAPVHLRRLLLGERV